MYYLCSFRSYRGEVSDDPEQEVLQLAEIIGTNARGFIDQKHNVRLHPATH